MLRWGYTALLGQTVTGTGLLHSISLERHDCFSMLLRIHLGIETDSRVALYASINNSVLGELYSSCFIVQRGASEKLGCYPCGGSCEIRASSGDKIGTNPLPWHCSPGPHTEKLPIK